MAMTRPTEEMEEENYEHKGEVLTISTGPFANLVTAHYINSLSTFDSRQATMYQQPVSRHGVAVPRAVVLDWAGGSRIKKQWRMGRQTSAYEAAAEEMEVDEPESEEQGETPYDDPFGCESFDAFAREHKEQQQPEAAAAAVTKSDNRNGTELIHWWKAITPKLSDRTVSLMSENICRDNTAHEAYGSGQECWKANKAFFEDDFMDNVRYFFEGMDHCQGVNLLVDGSGLFGGIAHQLLGDLRDDFGRTAVFTTSLFSHNADELDDNGDKEKNHERSVVFQRGATGETDFEALRRWERQGVNRCMNHAILSDLSSAYMPIDVATWTHRGGTHARWKNAGWLQGPTEGGMAVDPLNPIETGALAATALSTLFSPLASGEMTLPNVCDTLHPLPSMRLSSLQVAAPLRLSMAAERFNFQKLLDGTSFSNYLPLSHGWPTENGKRLVGRKEVATLSQIFVARGVHQVPRFEAKTHTLVANEHWAEEFKTPRTHSCVPVTPQLLGGTFPTNILPPNLNAFGWHDVRAPTEYLEEEHVPFQVPVASHVATTCASAMMLSSLRSRLVSADRRRHDDQHMEQDQWAELKEQMAAVCCAATTLPPPPPPLPTTHTQLVDEYDQGLGETGTDEDEW